VAQEKLDEVNRLLKEAVQDIAFLQQQNAALEEQVHKASAWEPGLNNASMAAAEMRAALVGAGIIEGEPASSVGGAASAMSSNSSFFGSPGFGDAAVPGSPQAGGAAAARARLNTRSIADMRVALNLPATSKALLPKASISDVRKELGQDASPPRGGGLLSRFKLASVK
jgi:hypothetical protein